MPSIKWTFKYPNHFCSCKFKVWFNKNYDTPFSGEFLCSFSQDWSWVNSSQGIMYPFFCLWLSENRISLLRICSLFEIVRPTLSEEWISTCAGSFAQASPQFRVWQFNSRSLCYRIGHWSHMGLFLLDWNLLYVKGENSKRSLCGEKTDQGSVEVQWRGFMNSSTHPF